MYSIDDYFKEEAREVNFIELKDYSNLDLDGQEDLPLPLVSDVLAQGISRGNLADKVETEMIIDGMIYFLGTDSLSDLAKTYSRVLKKYHSNIGDYIFFKGIKYLDGNQEKRANIYFRALSYIEPDHLPGRFNYGLALERIGQDFINKGQENIGGDFIARATYEFESILDLEEDYPLAYYKLGYHYSFNKQYLKAKLMWEKYIKLDKDELRIQEVREQIREIDDQVSLETGLTYLSYNRFEEALAAFLKILPRYESWWELRYLIGNTYGGLNQGERAIEEYRAALDLNKLEEDVYNELGIELFKLGQVEEALKVYNQGVENLGTRYKLLYNRGLAHYQLGDYRAAYEDVSRASDINPGDKNILETKKDLEDLI